MIIIGKICVYGPYLSRRYLLNIICSIKKSKQITNFFKSFSSINLEPNKYIDINLDLLVGYMLKIFGESQMCSLWKLSDEELSLKVRNWDSQAFEVLYDRYKDKIFSYIRNILNYNQDDASNVLSDVFIKVFEYLKNYEVKNFKTFIYRIAHNTAIDWIRGNKSWMYADEEWAKLIEDKQNIIEKEQLNTDFKQKIMMWFLREIEEKFRNVLYLYYYEENPYEEIAQIMESNKNSIWTLILNAKKALKEKIKDEKTLEALEK